MDSSRKMVYAVITNTDRTEGRGYNYPIHVSESPITAKRLGKGRYIQGDDCPIREKMMIEIEGVWYIEASAIEIIKPSKEDIEAQEENERKEAKRTAKIAATDKARAAGLSDEDIAAIAATE